MRIYPQASCLLLTPPARAGGGVGTKPRCLLCVVGAADWPLAMCRTDPCWVSVWYGCINGRRGRRGGGGLRVPPPPPPNPTRDKALNHAVPELKSTGRGSQGQTFS